MEIQDILQGLSQAEINAITSPDERSLIVNTTLQQAVVYVNGTFKQSSFENTDDIPEGTNKFATSADLSQISTNASDITSLQTGKEDTFTKNTAFNKDFGTSAGEVLEGNTTTITPTQASDIASNNAKISFPEAPNDGKQYARKDLGWEEVAASATASALPVIVLKSNDDANTFTRTSPLIIPWNVEKYKDTGFSHSNSTNNTRATVDDESTYQIGGRIRVRNTIDQRAQPTIKVFINGTEQDWNLASGYIRNAGNSSDDWTLEFTYEPEKLNANDYIELELSHEDANPTTVDSTFVGTESAFWIIRLQGAKGDQGATGPAGSVNSASNKGTGDGVFKTLNVDDLEFKSLKAGTNITITSSADELEIEANSTAGVQLYDQIITASNSVSHSASTGTPTDVPTLSLTVAETGDYIVYGSVNFDNLNLDNSGVELAFAVNNTTTTQPWAVSPMAKKKKYNGTQGTWGSVSLTAGQTITLRMSTGGSSADIESRKLYIATWK
jgi:hypothetical protein